ncbi:AbrB/MazE/SpoVT family DNA-binding domain-containing protein [Archaeoglobales archaeon]|nr:MAG: AbrB/MazE/SpoVT family DNA-binding domain-containing protein [Archaeoglobales archaeon]
MVRLKIRVGPKGQIVIPKVLREAYNIVEGGIVIIEPREDGILIRKIADPDKVIEWIKARRKRINGKMGHLGDLRTTDLEEEFEE